MQAVPAWKKIRPGWYHHPQLGEILFKTPELMPDYYMPKRGWWWFGKFETRGPFKTLKAAKETAAKLG